LFFGYLSDRCGRRIALITAILTVTISPAIGAYMPSAAGFGFFRFLMGKIILVRKVGI
jgi:MFS family permease